MRVQENEWEYERKSESTRERVRLLYERTSEACFAGSTGSDAALLARLVSAVALLAGLGTRAA